MARIVARAPERWVFETEASGERLLVLTQAYVPGWEASVDGAPVPLVRADYFFQGVYLPAGAHRVELHYRPRSLLVGLALTAIALVVAVVVFALGDRGVTWLRRVAPRRHARAAASE